MLPAQRVPGGVATRSQESEPVDRRGVDMDECAADEALETAADAVRVRRDGRREVAVERTSEHGEM